jgi:hypothetical protein
MKFYLGRIEIPSSIFELHSEIDQTKNILGVRSQISSYL